MKKLILILTCIIASIGFSSAQTKRATGTVIDDTGETVIGASVVVKGTTLGTTTDLDGKFSIEVPSDKKTLIISLISYKSKEIPVGTNVNVLLEPDSKLIDEVVVTGYGVQKKATFTGSATTVNSKALSDLAVTSVDKALQGNSPGLLSQSSSGQPGAGQQIVIRGIGSIKGGTDPLWIIDGVPVATGNFGQMASTGNTDYSDNSNALAGINPNDIESITVLKDASSTSIYGSRAANGVILVTTKSGAEGKTKFMISSQYGWSSRTSNKFKVMDRDQYIDYITDALINANRVKDADAALAYIKSNFPLDKDGNLYNYDWIKKAYRDNAPSYSFSIQANGGNNKTKFFTSIGYMSQDGILESSDMNRISAKLNLTHSASDRLRIGMNNSLSLNKQDTPLTTSSYFANPVLASSIIPPIDPGEIDGELVDLQTLSANFLYNTRYDYSKQRTYRVVSSAFAEYDIIKDLTFKTLWGVDFMQVNESEWSDSKTPGNTAHNLGGRGTRTAGENLVWNISNTLSYNKIFDNVHNVNVMLGQELSSTSYRYSVASSEGFPSSSFQELTAGANPVEARSDHTDTKLTSFFGRLNYSYDNKYIGSLSYRRDGSSRFSKDHLYASFWSVGAQWRISQEKFMQDIDWISNLGLRASYGTTGNSSIKKFSIAASNVYISPEYPSLALVEAGANYAGVSGVRPFQVENKDLKWEKSGAFNVGIDFSVLNNRLSTTLEFYNKRTSDLLLDVNLPATTGILKNMQNIGSMQNRGVEWTINALPFITKDFEWSVNLNISHNDNKVLNLYNKQDIISGIRILREGEDIQSIWGYKWAGVDSQDGAPMWYDKEGNKVKDYSKAEKQILGSAAPKLFGGLTNSFKYKGFDLSALLYFSYGNKISDQTLAMVNSFGARGWYNQSVDALDRWKQEGDVTDVPKVVFGDTKRNAFSSRFVYNGSYIRLRNVTLGYTIPKVSGLRVYFQGTNLLTFTKYEGLDPETGINGSPWFGYPISRTVMFGFDYKF